MLFTVGEMARELGIPASTLRYYDQEGLLPFVKRSGSGMRIFTDADYETLMVIGYLKKSGLSIKEIKSFISMAAQGDASIKDRLALFRGRRTAVQKQIGNCRRLFLCWNINAGTMRLPKKPAPKTPSEPFPRKTFPRNTETSDAV